jgi:hypothetical protein
LRKTLASLPFSIAHPKEAINMRNEVRYSNEPNNLYKLNHQRKKQDRLPPPKNKNAIPPYAVAISSSVSSDNHHSYNDHADSDYDNDGYEKYSDDEKEERVPQSHTEEATIVTNATVMSHTMVTIAVFGAYGKTGAEFIRVALDAGYRVQTMSVLDSHHPHQPDRTGPSSSAASNASQPPLQMETIEAESWDDVDAIQKTIHNSHYVVCLLNDPDSMQSNKQATTSSETNNNSNHDRLYRFIRLLYPCMRRTPSVQVVVWQAHALSPDVYGATPWLGKVCRTLWLRRRSQTRWHDKVIHYMAHQHDILASSSSHKNDTHSTLATKERSHSTASASNTTTHHRHSHASTSTSSTSRTPKPGVQPKTAPEESDETTASAPHFSFIITRPSMWIKDGPSIRKCAASKSVSRLHCVLVCSCLDVYHD